MASLSGGWGGSTAKNTRETTEHYMTHIVHTKTASKPERKPGVGNPACFIPTKKKADEVSRAAVVRRQDQKEAKES